MFSGERICFLSPLCEDIARRLPASQKDFTIIQLSWHPDFWLSVSRIVREICLRHLVYGIL